MEKKAAKGANSGKKGSKVSLKEKVQIFCKGVKSEFKKIIWPTKDSLEKQTIAVLIVSVLLGGFIRVYDILCQYMIGFIK